MKTIISIPLISLFLTFCPLKAQTIEEYTRSYLKQNAQKYDLSEGDIEDWVITSHHKSEQSNIDHIYGVQRFNGIEIYTADFSLHLIDNLAIKFNSNLITNLEKRTLYSKKTPEIDAITAVSYAINELGTSCKEPWVVLEANSEKDQKHLISKSSVSSLQIPVKLMYYLNEDGALYLSWDVTIELIENSALWNLKIDAVTGGVLHKVNLTKYCSFNGHEHFHKEKSNTKPNKPLSKGNTNKVNLLTGSYIVYPVPIENPHYGNRSAVVNPDDPIASPYGWHDIDGIPGAEFFITKGNNVDAYDDDDNSNSPSIPFTYPAFPSSYAYGGPGLAFGGFLNPTYSNSTQSQNAAITNAFYWANSCHDIMYHYGFDEVSGNFQENNYGNGGLGGDYVKVEVQNEIGTNTPIGCTAAAQFNPTLDGTSPRLEIPVCDSRDAAIDNLVIVHEYAHGISSRLVGGPNATNVLINFEQMDEGWSDWYGLMLTMKVGDTESDPRGVGTWFSGQGPNDPGLRPYPYNTDMSINPLTYDHIKTLAMPHDTGSVWTTMLWEVTWKFINLYGFDPDLYNGQGGNNKMLLLITEALKLTPTSPGFVDARNAILLADQVLFGGIHNCIIWGAFAKRGLGDSADQGSSWSVTDGTEAFDLPSYCTCPEDLVIEDDVYQGDLDQEAAQNTLTALNTINSGGLAFYHAYEEILFQDDFDALHGAELCAVIRFCVWARDEKEVSGEIISIDYDVKGTFKKNSLYTVSLVPNPAEERFSVTINNNGKHLTNFTVNLFNTLGSFVHQTKNNGLEQIEVDVSNLPPALYLVQITTNDGTTITKKLIKR